MIHSTDANSNNPEHSSDAYQKRHKVYSNKPKRVIEVILFVNLNDFRLNVNFLFLNRFPRTAFYHWKVQIQFYMILS